MAIQAVCTSCGKRFQAPDHFVGKRVKCKGCGTVFEIQASLGEKPGVAGGVDLDSLAKLEHSFSGQPAGSSHDTHAHSKAGTRVKMQAPSAVIAAEQEEPDPLAIPPELRGRPNRLIYHTSLARSADEWLPMGLTLLGFAAMALAATAQEVKGVIWIGFVRFLLPCLLYSAVIFPVTMSMLSRAARTLKYQLPPQPKLRAFACYMPALAMLTSLWLAGNGASVGQIMGGFLGLAISSVAVWILYRLQEEEIAMTVAYGAGGFAIGTTVCVMLLLVLNLLAGSIVTASKAQAKVPVSPIGPGLSWINDPNPAPPTAVAGPVKSSEHIAPIKQSEVPETPSTAAIISVETGKISGTISEIIEPLSGAPVAAVLRVGTHSATVESWNFDTWHAQTNVLQLTTRPKGRLVLSPDGTRLAWIAEFPRLSIQIFSFSTGTLSNFALDRTSGIPELISFVAPERILLHWMAPAVEGHNTPQPGAAATTGTPSKKDNQSIFDEGLNGASDPVAAPATPASPAQPPAVITPTLEVVSTATGTRVCRLAIPPSVASLTMGNDNLSAPAPLGMVICPTAQRIAMVGKTADAPALFQFDLNSGTALPILKIGDVDASQSTSLTGLAYSTDGAQLTLLLEHSGSALLLRYDANTGSKIGDGLYPSGPLEGDTHPLFTGNALASLDQLPYWLVYGKGLIDQKTYQHVHQTDFPVTNVVSQRLLDDGRIALVCPGPGNRQVNLITIDKSSLAALNAPPTTQP